jgi:hypothetical protein
MKKLNKKLAAGILIVFFAIVAIWVIPANFEIVPNYSESLPYKWVLVKKGLIPTKRDEVFVFYVRGNKMLGVDKIKFIKLVGGLPGDKIEKQGGVVMKDGKPVFRTIADSCNTKDSKDVCDKPIMTLFGTLDPNTNPDEDMWYRSFKSPTADVKEVLKKRNMDITDKTVSVSGKQIGVIKGWSKKSEPLSAIHSGIIPGGKFFAYTPHIDSFDSRYQEIGLIDEKDIIGTAILTF